MIPEKRSKNLAITFFGILLIALAISNLLLIRQNMQMRAQIK